MAYFVGFVVGGSLGAGLLITWIGFPILVGTPVAATVAASLEVTLARALVGVTLVAVLLGAPLLYDQSSVGLTTDTAVRE